MSVTLAFPDGTYNTSNKPSVATLKNDLSLIEDDLNAHEADTTIHFTRAQINAPQGFLINGKISVTDTGSGLTVAIKTLAGTDPSASDPVYVRIGDTVRTISAALSVTKADGTNWCNAGSAELATKEIDYFVYLGYNATDGVVIGFSRYPGANSYDDFSATSTNEKYCAISTITTAAATDYYEVVGRFAATLSAGAGYTWSVPTYTAKNLIQRPIYETRWLTCVPTIAGEGGGTAPTYTTQFINRYKVVGNSFCGTYSWSNVAGGTAGSGANIITVTLPFGISSTASGIANSRYVIGSGFIYESAGTVGTIVANIYNTTANKFYMVVSTLATTTLNDQSSVDRGICLAIQYEI